MTHALGAHATLTAAGTAMPASAGNICLGKCFIQSIILISLPTQQSKVMTFLCCNQQDVVDYRVSANSFKRYVNVWRICFSRNNVEYEIS